MTEKILPCNRPLMVKGRIREAIRLSLNVDRSTKPLVIAYHRYKFPDTLQYLNEVSVATHKHALNFET